MEPDAAFDPRLAFSKRIKVGLVKGLGQLCAFDRAIPPGFRGRAGEQQGQSDQPIHGSSVRFNRKVTMPCDTIGAAGGFSTGAISRGQLTRAVGAWLGLCWHAF